MAPGFFLPQLGPVQKAKSPSPPWSELLDVGTQHYKQNKLRDAETPLRKAVKLLESAKGRDHKRTLAAKFKWGVTLFELREHDKSELLLRDVVSRQTVTYGADDKKTLSSNYWLARVYFEQTKYGQAETLLQDIERRETIDTFDDTGDRFFWLGHACVKQEKFAEAERAFGKASERAERALGGDREKTIDSHHWLGYARFKQNDWRNAEKAFRKAVESSERLGGPNDERRLNTNYWLGRALHQQGKWGQAEGPLRKAADGYERTEGDDHEYTSNSHYWLGQTLYHQNMLAEAEVSLQMAAEAFERTRGRDNESTIQSHHWLAKTFYEQKKWQKAEDAFRKALEGSERTRGRDNGSTIVNFYWLGLSLCTQAKWSEAEKPLRSAEAGMERCFGSDDLLTLRNKFLLGRSILHQRKNDAEAEGLLRSSADGLGKRTDEEAQMWTASGQHGLGVVLDRQQKYGEAEETFLQAAKSYERRVGPDDGRTALSYHLLGKTLCSQEKYEKAKPPLQRAAEVYAKTYDADHKDAIEVKQLLEKVHNQLSKAILTEAKETVVPHQEPVTLEEQSTQQPRESPGTSEVSVTPTEFNYQAVIDPQKLMREKYTVGWICALPIELAAAEEMLDDEHGEFQRERDDADENLYVLGSIGKHNTVIVCLPAGRIGSNPAAAVATQMRSTFRGIRFVLMVGIGGGVPSEEADVRLGDVVVGQPHNIHGGVVQYDMGKTTPSGFARTGMLNMPPQMLLAAVARVRANEFRGRSKFCEHLSRFEDVARFQRARAGHDILFDATYDHEGYQTCEECRPDKQVSRSQRETTEEVVVHYGTIASGNQVMRTATERDRVSKELGGVLCFEMEGAGLMNNFPCLMVRGICDYSDSHKNKSWQAYAAGTAAAWAKELLSVIPAADEL